MRAVHFGAGNIGRGFIGLLLVRSGYEVVFVDVNPELVRLIEERHGYTVRILEDEARLETVTGVTAIDGGDLEAVASTIATADLVTTSVGPGVLPHLAPGIAAGLRRRGGKTLNLIPCENMVGSGTALREAVLRQTGGDPLGARFPNAVVDRIVPNLRPGPGEDPLLITVESYYEWLVDEAELAQPAPPVEGLRPVRDLAAYTERKLFGLNTGHAVTAYLGYLKGHRYIHQAVQDPSVRSTLLGSLVEAGLALVLRHGFTEAEQAAYAGKLLKRFANPALGDLVARVGREPSRKLGPSDRFVAPARMAAGYGIIPVNLARGIAAGFRFDPPEDPGAIALAGRVRREGIGPVMKEVSGIDPDSPLGGLVLQEAERLQERFGG